MANSSIQFECLKCGQEVVAEHAQCGEQLPCPKCYSMLVVPPRSIDASLFDDIFDSLQESRNPDEGNSKQLNASAAKPTPLCPSGNPTASTSPPEKTTDQVVSSPAPTTTATEKIPSEALESLDIVGTDTEDSTESPEDVLESYLASVSIPEPAEQQSLKVEGLEFEHLNQILSVKCRICDSLIHTNMVKAGQEVECPVCFSTVEVTEANIRKSTPKNHSNSRETRLSIDSSQKSKPNSAKSDVSDDPLEEFKLSPPTVNPSEKTKDQKTPGVTSVKTSARQPETVSNDTSSFSSDSNSAPQTEAPKKSRRELYEASQRKLREAEQGTPPKINRPKSIPPKGEPTNSNTEAVLDDRWEPVSWSDLIKGMLSGSTTVAILVLATMLIAIGSLLMSFFVSGANEDIKEKIISGVLWLFLGAIPYAIGTLFLWFISGRMFREAATGNRKIASWKVESSSDFWSTLTLFGFSMLVAGLPISPVCIVIPFFYPFISPLRFILAPLLLVAAWFNQNPLAIIGSDAFKNFTKESKLWGSFYYPVVGLALLAFVGGLLLMIPMTSGGFVSHPIGAAIVVFATASFAIVTGRHCGEVVNNLRPKEKKGLKKREDQI